jgi:hypothetical protein
MIPMTNNSADLYVCEENIPGLLCVWYGDEIMEIDLQVDWQEAVEVLPGVEMAIKHTYQPEELERTDYHRSLFIFYSTADPRLIIDTIHRIFREVAASIESEEQNNEQA